MHDFVARRISWPHAKSKSSMGIQFWYKKWNGTNCFRCLIHNFIRFSSFDGIFVEFFSILLQYSFMFCVNVMWFYTCLFFYAMHKLALKWISGFSYSWHGFQKKNNQCNSWNAYIYKHIHTRISSFGIDAVVVEIIVELSSIHWCWISAFSREHVCILCRNWIDVIHIIGCRMMCAYTIIFVISNGYNVNSSK